MVVVHGLQELSLELKNQEPQDIFIIGGAKFYKTMLDYCETAYITKVNADGQAQVFFENLDELENWQIVSESEEIIDGDYTIKFLTYKNNKVKEF